MKTNKVFKWLYGVFMFLPMLAIGVTCAYVTFNKNAKDSYGGQVQAKYESNEVNSIDDLVVGNLYTLTINQSDIPTSNTIWLKIKNAYNVPYQDNITTNILSDDINTYFYVRANANGTVSLTNESYSNITIIQIVNNNYPFVFQIEYLEIVNNSLSYDHLSYTNFNIYENQYNAQSTLDNAFYYAVDQFNDSGFNKVDFVSYFDMFYNNTSIWTTFANTYMNYVLFVSLAFFIPRVLFWFINFSFSIVDSFSDKYKRW